MTKEGPQQFNKEESGEEVKHEEPKEKPQLIKLSWLEKEAEKKEEVEKGHIKLSWLKKEEKKAEPVPEKFASLEEKRNAYIEGYQKFLREAPRWRSAVRRIFGTEYKEDDLPEDLKKLKAEYDEAKYAYCKDLIAAKKADLEKEGKSSEALDKELAAYKFTELYSKIFLEERDLLQKAKIEAWPPKEKGIFRRGLDLWMRQGRGTRILISTAALTGISIATGGVASAGIGAAAIFAGSRYVKGFASAIMAQGVGKGVNWVFSKSFIDRVKKEIEETEQKSKEEFSKSEMTLESIKAIEARRQQLTEKLAKREIAKVIAKAGAMIGTGVGASIGLNMLENTYAGEVKSFLGIAEKPRAPEMSPEEYAKFKSYENVSARHNVEALKDAAKVRAEAILEEQHIENLATIKPGEGAWNAIYRQLENQLDKNPKKFGLKPEDLDSAAKFKFLTQETNKILTDNGYIKPDGMEIRIAKPGVKVFLEPDNKISIKGEGKLTYEWLKPKAEISIQPEMPPVPKFEGYSLIQDFGDKNLAQQESIIGNLDHQAQNLQNQLSLTDEFSPERYRIQEQLEHLAILKEQAVNTPSFIESHENFISYLYFFRKEIGLKFDEYGAIKDVKVGKFLEEISKYQQGEVLDEAGMRVYPDLPHSGIYGGIELRHQIKLAETLKGILKVKAPEGGLDMTIDELIKNHIGGVLNKVET